MQEAEGWTEQEINERIEELKLIRQAEIQTKKAEKLEPRDPNDPLANGTYVRYMAFFCFGVLGWLLFSGFKDGIQDNTAKK